MSSLNFLISELQALATETRRRYPDIRENADKAVALLRAEGPSFSPEGPYLDELLKPVFLGCATKNAKVVVISLGALQRLIALKAIPLRAIPQILVTMLEIMGQGVDIQLRILQALLSLVTNFPEVHGTTLGEALLLCFRLQESRIVVVSSTAAATLRQLVMYIFEKVLNDKEPENLHQIKLPDDSVVSLRGSELDAYCVFEDLCLLANQEHPNFLRLEFLPKTFALELIESVLTNYHALFHQHQEILLLLRHHLSPLLLKSLSERPTFPLTLRATRVVFILLRHFSDELETESEVFSMMLIKMVSGEETHTMDGVRRPHWMRVLAAEVIRGICTDAELMRRYFARYDAHGGSHVFSSLIAALKRLVTEKPVFLGIGNQMQGVGVQPEGAPHSKLENVAGMVANAASHTVSGALGIGSNATGLSLAGCMMKVQCIDQLDKTDAPPMPEGYIFLLGLQCLVSIAEGFAATTLPAFTSLQPRTSSRLPSALDLSSLDQKNPTVQQLQLEKAMIESAWPALLAALSFLMGTNLSDELFAEVLGALQGLTNVSGALGLSTPRDAFLTSLSKLAIPSRVVTKLDSWVEPATPRGGSGMGVVDGLAALANAATGTGGVVQMPFLSERNMACLKVFIYVASYLGGTLGESWFAVLETLQNADYVLTGKGTKRRTATFVLTPPSKAIPTSNSSGLTSPMSQEGETRPLLLMEVEPEHVLAAIQGLFESSKDMEDNAFHDFSVALCKLSEEMIGMQVSNEMEDTAVNANTGPVEGNGAPPSPSVSTSPAHRRRVSGIQLTRTPRSGDFGVTKLGMIALLNTNRLLYEDGEIAWNPITSHLIKVLRHPLAPSTVRLQAAQNLDSFLTVIPRSLGNLTRELTEKVQQRTLDVLALQVLTEGGSPTVLDIRRMGLETLHQILQTGSHTIVVGWETILEMLSSVCKPVSMSTPTPLASQESLPTTPLTATSQNHPIPLVTTFSEKPNLSLIRIAFQSLTLVCESLLSLSPSQLKLCISTLGLFGRQTDTNIALTAAESLLWGVSDSIQLRRKDPATESQYSDLWMFLLNELLVLCTDARPEVRGGSIQTLFRTMQLYGMTLSLETWDQCMWQIAFPLLDALRNGAALVSPDADGSSVAIAAWDESKTLALQSIGSLFNDFLMSKLIQLEDFGRIWDALVEHIQNAVLHENRPIGTIALRALEKALKAFKDPTGPIRPIADRSSERVWVTWEITGQAIGIHPSPSNPYTQECLVAFVDVVKSLRTLSKAVKGHEWKLERLRSLMSILKSLMIYPFSPDYRPDIDALTPLQGDLLSVFDTVDLLIQGSSSLLLADLAYFTTLAFVGDIHPAIAAQPEAKGTTKVPITYIALCKRTMPLLAHMFLRFKSSPYIYADGTVEAILAAYAIPIKLKYDCPAPSKFGADQPLWKMATINFLSVSKECTPRVAEFQEVPDESVAKIWGHLLEVFRGALLADCSSVAEDSSDENFDYAFINAIEAHIAPHLGNSRIPDGIITEFGKVLQHASKIHEVKPSPLHSRSSSTHTLVGQSPQTPSEPMKQFEEGNLSDVIGTTIPASVLPRERFSYWCFELLFLMCSHNAQGHEPSRRRVAALCLPNLLSRMSQVLRSYCLDTPLYGDMPFTRVREEELIYVLRKMESSRLWSGSLWASQSDTPSVFAQQQPDVATTIDTASLIRDVGYRSERAHLFYCYSLLLQVASAAKPATAWLPDRHSAFDALATPSQNSTVQFAHFNSRELAISCLQIVGEEMGLPT